MCPNAIRAHLQCFQSFLQVNSTPTPVVPQVDAVTHGLINCGRRVANILFAIVWFRIPVSLFNGIGIALALFGAFCYMQAKQRSIKSRAPPPQFPPKANLKSS